MTFDLLLVALGGAAGSVLRFLVGKLAIRLFGAEFPRGTLIVNLAGSLLIGLAVGFLDRGLIPPRARPLLVAGFLGGLTTFSTYAMGSFEFLRRGQWLRGMTEILGFNVLGLALAGLGWALATRRFG